MGGSVVGDWLWPEMGTRQEKDTYTDGDINNCDVVAIYRQIKNADGFNEPLYVDEPYCSGNSEYDRENVDDVDFRRQRSSVPHAYLCYNI